MWKAIVAAMVILLVGVSFESEGGEVYDGHEFIVYSGSVVEGDLQTLTNVIGRRTGLLVFLNSPGGSVQEGLAIMAFFKEKNVKTLIAPNDECLSICSAIWLAGSTRAVLPDGKLGVHQPFMMPEVVITMTQYEYAFGTMQTMGYWMYSVDKAGIVVDNYFFMALLNTPPNEMYIFNRDELEILEIK